MLPPSPPNPLSGILAAILARPETLFPAVPAPTNQLGRVPARVNPGIASQNAGGNAQVGYANAHMTPPTAPHFQPPNQPEHLPESFPAPSWLGNGVLERAPQARFPQPTGLGAAPSGILGALSQLRFA